jgi:antitoxin component YwqK of YwqJK toxin-antitoxin module
MKNILTSLLILSFFNSSTHAQKIKYFEYFLNKDLVSTEKANMEIYGEGRYHDNSFMLNCFSADKTRLLMTAYFTDSSLAAFDGEYFLYHYNGKVDTRGNYKMNVQFGLWQKWDSTGKMIDSSIYKNDKIIIRAIFDYNKNKQLLYYSITDSIRNTKHTEHYDSLGNIVSRADFKGDVGTIWNKTMGREKIDTVYTRDEIESFFVGGSSAFRNFLTNNLKFSIAAENGAPPGRYTVVVKFIVDIDGSVSDVEAETNAGYGTEQEVIRVIKLSRKWEPGIQYGRKVKSVKRQPITFYVENN